MKKVLAILGVACIVFSVCACSSSAPVPTSKASSKAVSIGKQAFDIIDQYLDGTETYRTVSDTLYDLHDRMRYASEYSYPYTDEQRADYDIQRYILFASTYIHIDHNGGTPENYEKIISYRNKIAGLVGEDAR